MLESWISVCEMFANYELTFDAHFAFVHKQALDWRKFLQKHAKLCARDLTEIVICNAIPKNDVLIDQKVARVSSNVHCRLK